MKAVHIILISLFAIILAASTKPVSAHVLVVDTTDSKGAILHINPNDSPVAGEAAALIFDSEDNLINKNSQVSLQIKDEAGKTDKVKMEVDKSLAVVQYNFPSQGVYKLSFQIDNKSEITRFNYTQRVSRGAVANNLDQSKPEWAELLLMTSGFGVIVLAILAFNNRRAIKRYSTF